MRINHPANHLPSDSLRITKASLNANKVSIVADVTAAYEPEVGVKSFVREFEFSAPNNFVITDKITMNSPKLITSFFHADNLINELTSSKFVFEPNGVNLLVDIVEPKIFSSKIEKNILTAPGQPGSVDKGEREERGVKLSISTKEKVKTAKFVTRLTIQSR